jgi:hypothetical protein
MAKHRRHSIQFKRQVAQEFIASEAEGPRQWSGPGDKPAREESRPTVGNRSQETSFQSQTEHQQLLLKSRDARPPLR